MTESKRDLKDGEYIDHIKVSKEHKDVFVCLILEDGEYVGFLNLKERS